MLTGDLAEPDGADQLHRCQPWALRIGLREHERDSMRTRNLDRSIGSELVLPGIPGLLRRYERVDDADSMWFRNIQFEFWLQRFVGLRPDEPRLLR